MGSSLSNPYLVLAGTVAAGIDGKLPGQINSVQQPTIQPGFPLDATFRAHPFTF